MSRPNERLEWSPKRVRDSGEQSRSRDSGQPRVMGGGAQECCTGKKKGKPTPTASDVEGHVGREADSHLGLGRVLGTSDEQNAGNIGDRG